MTGRRDTPRAMALWRYRCYADPRYFVPCAQIPPDVREALEAELATNGDVPCLDEEPGEIGIWCGGCRFGEQTELYVSSSIKR